MTPVGEVERDEGKRHEHTANAVDDLCLCQMSLFLAALFLRLRLLAAEEQGLEGLALTALPFPLLS